MSNFLQILKDINAVQHGHFLLSSGLHSDTYIQCARIFEKPEISEIFIQELIKKIKNEINVVIGPAIGAIHLAYETARQLKVRNIFAERENDQMTFRRDFIINNDDKILLVEDVVTTGRSLKQIIKALSEFHHNIIGIASIINRSNEKIFEYPYEYILKIEANNYNKENCPICKKGKIPVIKPGSRIFHS